ncbi:MAG: uridylate kinase [Parcubacteria group bacterium Greene0714_21]|nr:MAG: uridylate kinase [Parcubacteria group bacterium Greene0416_39]TSC97538.1 MAG: uridylate kinase [Parcubacteria group bacterium Greene1014_47]TSD04414.1 MAG: uridylate kinase [Parcubacteria group bacterium Greene0714_21]
MKERYIVISLGGSLIVPHLSDEGGINVQFLRKFRAFILQQIQKGRYFIIVPGGGKTCRFYQQAGRKIVRMSNDDLDWIGIHSTRLNAQLLRTIFVKEAHLAVIDHDPSKKEVEQLHGTVKKVFIASGWRPGQSTDHVAVRLAQKFGAREVINASNISFVFNKDPKKHKDAKSIREIAWKEYRKLIPLKWTPGLSSPFDPVAAKLAEKINLKVKILRGEDLENFKKAIEGKPFEGTLIS